MRCASESDHGTEGSKSYSGMMTRTRGCLPGTFVSKSGLAAQVVALVSPEELKAPFGRSFHRKSVGCSQIIAPVRPPFAWRFVIVPKSIIHPVDPACMTVADSLGRALFTGTDYLK